MTRCRATILKIPSARRGRWKPALPQLARGLDGLRVAVAGGYFRKQGFPEAYQAIDQVAKALNVSREVELPEAHRARAAAYVITTTEGAALHLDRLRERPNDFDPAVRDRLIAGAMIPSALVVKAQKFRRWYREQVLALFKDVDAIIAPATPCTAPLIGQQNFTLDGVEMPVRANLGIYTQPISFIGLPVVAVPVPLEAAADRRADHRCAVAGGHRLADRAGFGGAGRGVGTEAAFELEHNSVHSREGGIQSLGPRLRGGEQ